MNLLDLIKATIGCAGIAFLVYRFPVLSQAVIIGLLIVVSVFSARLDSCNVVNS
jgi:hypothetical protein